ncbi:MAG: hypothetical protein KDJ75_00245 [Alphaproteobacteria bacterium]|nr:hypothetical protein [Alphaproteobacteria bacterium]
MFSNIGNIFAGSEPRRTESTDTRQAIQRHDPDFEKRRSKKDSRNHEHAQEEDMATVSVESLHLFLDNLLRVQNAPLAPESSPENAPEDNEEMAASEESGTVQEQETPEHHSPPNGPAAHAAQAYAQQAHHQGQSWEDVSSDPHTPPPSGHEHAPLLSAEQIRTIHTLLDDLRILSERKIPYIRIERGESFLDSLVIAITKAVEASSRP